MPGWGVRTMKTVDEDPGRCGLETLRKGGYYTLERAMAAQNGKASLGGEPCPTKPRRGCWERPSTVRPASTGLVTPASSETLVPCGDGEVYLERGWAGQLPVAQRLTRQDDALAVNEKTRPA